MVAAPPVEMLDSLVNRRSFTAIAVSSDPETTIFSSRIFLVALPSSSAIANVAATPGSNPGSEAP
jgi:hypothetical protein